MTSSSIWIRREKTISINPFRIEENWRTKKNSAMKELRISQRSNFIQRLFRRTVKVIEYITARLRKSKCSN